MNIYKGALEKLERYYKGEAVLPTAVAAAIQALHQPTANWPPEKGDLISVVVEDNGTSPVEREFLSMDGDKFVCKTLEVNYGFFAWDNAKPTSKQPWIANTGDAFPSCGLLDTIDIRTRNGEVLLEKRAGNQLWPHSGGAADIIEWRLSE